MGREAECVCRWGEESGRCKVLLEGSELIVRGALRRGVPFSAMTGVGVRGEELVFSVDGVGAGFGLGAAVARKWAEAIVSPPVGLAKKLGIKADSRVLAVGEMDVPELAKWSGAASGSDVDLILLRAGSAVELEARLGECWGRIEGGTPVWVIYPKGKASPLGETAVREKMRGLRCVDTKVASISDTLTGLRFVRRTVVGDDR